MDLDSEHRRLQRRMQTVNTADSGANRTTGETAFEKKWNPNISKLLELTANL